jgi:hypothetical protein
MQHGSGSTCLACALDAALMGIASGAQDSQACPESHMFINSGRRRKDGYACISGHADICGPCLSLIRYSAAFEQLHVTWNCLKLLYICFKFLYIASYENILSGK